MLAGLVLRDVDSCLWATSRPAADHEHRQLTFMDRVDRTNVRSQARARLRQHTFDIDVNHSPSCGSATRRPRGRHAGGDGHHPMSYARKIQLEDSISRYGAPRTKLLLCRALTVGSQG